MITERQRRAADRSLSHRPQQVRTQPGQDDVAREQAAMGVHGMHEVVPASRLARSLGSLVAAINLTELQALPVHLRWMSGQVTQSPLDQAWQNSLASTAHPASRDV